MKPVLESVHHVNILVRDLEHARARFSHAMGVVFGPVETLAARGAIASRVRIGATWLVLVQPTDPDGVPGRRLATRGEGVFLVSFGVTDLDAAIAALGERGFGCTSDVPRRGLDDWRVIDTVLGAEFGVELQLCETPRQ
ncbi:MAG: VOC family protein [Steroidobacteraceae bacterium]